MIDLKIEGLYELKADFSRMRVQNPIALAKSVKVSLYLLERYIKEDELNGQILHHQSGTLSRSITVHMTGPYSGEVGTNIFYGWVNEVGMTIHAKNAPYLMFKVGAKGIRGQDGGSWRRVKQVTIPARPFMALALSHNLNTIIGVFKRNFDEATK
jgi:phage gpG-like protein